MKIPDILVINDSLLYFNTESRIIISNYKSGKISKIININDLFNVNKVLFTYNHIDTANHDYKKIDSIFNKSINQRFNILSATFYDDSNIFIPIVLKSPKLIIQGKDTEITIQYYTYTFIFNANDYSASNIRPFNLNWADTSVVFASPEFGLNIYKNKLYVANLSRPEYSGNILVSYDMSSLAQSSEQPTIRHIPFKSTVSFNTTNYYHFQNMNDGCFVDNVTRILELKSQKVLLDIKDYIPDATYISFFTPLDNDRKQWFINFTCVPPNQNNENIEKQIASMVTYNVIIDIHKHKVLFKEKTNFASFCRFKNHILSIEKMQDHYYYVDYKI